MVESCLFNDICGVCGGSGPDLYYSCEGSCLNDSDSDGVCDEIEVGGCTDQSAFNYNGLQQTTMGLAWLLLMVVLIHLCLITTLKLILKMVLVFLGKN